MSVFTSLAIILLAMLIQAFLQLTPGLFSIFYHHNLGKTSLKKADDRSLSFILGVEIGIAVVFLVTYLVINFLASKQDAVGPVFLWVMAGIFIADALITFFFYFKKFKKQKTKNKNSTALFISRHLASSLIHRAEHTKNRSDTIILGFIASLLELFLQLPLYIICSIEIISLSQRNGFVFIIAYIVIATIPLFAIRTAYKTGHNLAEIQRFRAHKKLPIKIILSLSFLTIAILTFITGLSI